MNRKQRIRWDLGRAFRAGASGTTARQDILQEVRDKYDLSTNGVGGSHAHAIFVHGSS